MAKRIGVWFGPDEYEQSHTDLRDTTCVVFDILRATSVITIGLANGAAGFIPVTSIAEALRIQSRNPGSLLGGERGGLRITRQAGGEADFDLGNSPREYVANRVVNRIVITTTTNGTRALTACQGAAAVGVGSFLNLSAVVRWLNRVAREKILLVCAGTGTGPGLEDILAAGAVAEELQGLPFGFDLEDSAQVAYLSWMASKKELFAAVRKSQNGLRLLALPNLRDDVAFCLRRDLTELVGVLDGNGVVRPVVI